MTNLEMYLTNWRKKTLPNTYVWLTHLAFAFYIRMRCIRYKDSSGFLVISDLVNHGSDVYSNDQSVTGVMDTRSHNFRYELNAKRVT